MLSSQEAWGLLTTYFTKKSPRIILSKASKCFLHRNSEDVAKKPYCAWCKLKNFSSEYLFVLFASCFEDLFAENTRQYLNTLKNVQDFLIYSVVRQHTDNIDNCLRRPESGFAFCQKLSDLLPVPVASFWEKKQSHFVIDFFPFFFSCRQLHWPWPWTAAMRWTWSSSSMWCSTVRTMSLQGELNKSKQGTQPSFGMPVRCGARLFGQCCYKVNLILLPRSLINDAWYY